MTTLRAIFPEYTLLDEHVREINTRRFTVRVERARFDTGPDTWQYAVRVTLWLRGTPLLLGSHLHYVFNQCPSRTVYRNTAHAAIRQFRRLRESLVEAIHATRA